LCNYRTLRSIPTRIEARRHETISVTWPARIQYLCSAEGKTAGVEWAAHVCVKDSGGGSPSLRAMAWTAGAKLACCVEATIQ